MTVEAALALCGLVTFVVLGVEVVLAVVDQLRCTDAAREAARLIARGEQPRAPTAVAAIAPAGAELSVRQTDDTVQVRVTSRHKLITIHATAYAVLEPGVPTTSPGDTDAQRLPAHTSPRRLGAPGAATRKPLYHAKSAV
ncbi:TadE family protein [Saccharothrix obliqua]|uniref:TadE family protein n=1 Tax=Saccharothrix obliqua TaxID=2861747 RepID=UPI001C5E7949|nr:TadE family protein [Saccharothrix obliqua]MBW4719808.1 pilus assembly protein [Saccharothrix obliqua]